MYIAMPYRCRTGGGGNWWPGGGGKGWPVPPPPPQYFGLLIQILYLCPLNVMTWRKSFSWGPPPPPIKTIFLHPCMQDFIFTTSPWTFHFAWHLSSMQISFSWYQYKHEHVVTKFYCTMSGNNTETTWALKKWPLNTGGLCMKVGHQVEHAWGWSLWSPMYIFKHIFPAMLIALTRPFAYWKWIGNLLS